MVLQSPALTVRVDKVARLDVQTLLYDPQDTDEANALSRDINHVRETSNLPSLALTPIGWLLPMPHTLTGAGRRAVCVAIKC